MSLVLCVTYLMQLFSQSSGEFAVVHRQVTPTRWSPRTLAPSHLCRSAVAEIHQKHSVICATIRRVNTVPSGSCTLLLRCCFLLVCVHVFIPSITISCRLGSVTMCHAEAFMRSFFVFSICLLLFVGKDNCLQTVADNLSLCFIFLLPAVILLSKESLIKTLRFYQ